MMALEEVVSCWEGWPTRYKLRALKGRTTSNEALNTLCLKEERIDFFDWVIENGNPSTEQLWEAAFKYESGPFTRKINRLYMYNNYSKCGKEFSPEIAEKISPGVVKSHVERVAIGWHKDAGWKNPALNPNFAIYKEVLHGLSIDEKKSLFNHEDERVRFWFLGISIVWDPMGLKLVDDSLANKIKKEENKFIKRLYVRPTIESFSLLGENCSRSEIDPLLQVLRVPEKFIRYKVAKYLMETMASFGYNTCWQENYKYQATKRVLMENIKQGDEKIAAWFFHHYLLEPKTVDLLRTLDKERFLGAWVNALAKTKTNFQTNLSHPIEFSKEEVAEVILKIREKYDDEPKVFLTCLMKLGMFGFVDYKDFKEELLGLYDEQTGRMTYIHDDFEGIESHKACVMSATPMLEDIEEMMSGFKALKESEDLKKKFGVDQKKKKRVL